MIHHMKTLKLVSGLTVAALAFSLMLSSCESNEKVEPQQDLLPQNFRVDIPNAISNKDLAGGRKGGRTQGDTLRGNEIYQNLGVFIAVGEGASQLVEDIINGIRKYHIDRVLTLTFVSDDDGRNKNLVVESQVTFENVVWDYQLTVTDADSENSGDGGKALQVFWNQRTPVKGIAIIKPYNCDRNKNQNAGDAIFRINYEEEPASGYDAQMEVLVSGLPLPSPLSDPYAMNTLRMFAGKKGDVVDVYGNSNHPNAVLFTGPKGLDWAFVASGNDATDIGVAEVGLPPSSLDEADRKVLLKDYSIKNVFTTQIQALWPGLDSNVIAAYLKNTDAPGYFSKKGFLSGGVSPGPDWDVLASRLDGLAPYKPAEISALQVSFK